MNICHRLARATSYGALLLSFSAAVFAAQLKENSADIQHVVNIPGMAININPGGTGCNPGRHEVWEPTQNGCSNIEWVKQTARVVSVTASPPSILANNIAASTLTATLVDGDGYLVGFGIPTSWGTTNGWLSNTSTVTDASGKTSVALRGTVAGLATVTAAAAAGAAAANVTLVPDASTSRVISLVPSPASAPANWTAAGLYATVRDAYNNILPAGQAVYWATTLGGLNTGISYTDGNGVAVAAISSGTQGLSTIYARTAVSANAATNVTFTAPPSTAPVLTSFSIGGDRFNEYQVNTSGNTIYSTTIFMWAATGATSYTLTTQDGFVWWSGTATQWNATNVFHHPVNANLGPAVFTLTAYNSNGQTATASVQPKIIYARLDH